MKAKFTKASKKDKVLTTMSVPQFANDDDLQVVGYFSNGDELTVVIDNVPTIFIVNRINKHGNILTAATKCFPRHLRLPSVGKPVYAKVTEIR